MPELPDVEKAAALIRSTAVGKKIVKVDTLEDSLVFSGSPHGTFAKEITGRVVKNAGRYGKVLYLDLDGEGRMPVLHFGMTGMLQVKGELPTYYRTGPSQQPPEWPPRFMKFILHLADDSSNEVTQLSFMDARRLGRIRLCASPLNESPICDLGFDPILSMPSREKFQALVLKRTCPIKALLLDQSFSAGVGNWVADEILYHSRVHPEQRCNTLSDSQIAALHQQTRDVCVIAVEANADESKFPQDWLFKHRWGKGKGKQKQTMNLPSGELATIKWVTVGGRTSAYVVELQRLPTKGTRGPSDVPEDDETEDGDLTPLAESGAEDPSTRAGRKRKVPSIEKTDLAGPKAGKKLKTSSQATGKKGQTKKKPRGRT